MLLITLIMTNLLMLGSSRIDGLIRFAALQGILLGFLPLISHLDNLTFRIVFIAVVGCVLKGLVFPWSLKRTMREADVRKEVEPYVGFTTSVIMGVVLLAASYYIGMRLPLPNPAISSLVVPVSFFTIFSGVLLIVARKKALTQVIGYLVLENGIYIFGVSLAYDAPLIVELGVFLDVFVAVFVMGIAMFHISREFDSLDTSEMGHLKE